jgi:hypothetical protein
VVGLGGTVGFVEVVGVVAGVAVVAWAVAGHPAGGRRRKVRRPAQVGKPAMWVVAGIVVDLENIQQMFSRETCRIKEIESIYLAG